jgi:hypothetical protein
MGLFGLFRGWARVCLSGFAAKARVCFGLFKTPERRCMAASHPMKSQTEQHEQRA